MEGERYKAILFSPAMHGDEYRISLFPGRVDEDPGCLYSVELLAQGESVAFFRPCGHTPLGSQAMHWVTRSVLLLSVVAACGREADPSPSGSLTPASTDVPTTNLPVPRAEPQVVFESDTGPIRVSLEVVSTPAKIQRGLMHRRHLAPDRGMLFVFSSERVRSFWMKNTLIPLDMIFVKADMSIAGIERDTVPLSKESRSVGIATRYVIEVNGGWTAKHGVNTGSRVSLENLPEIKNAPL